MDSRTPRCKSGMLYLRRIPTQPPSSSPFLSPSCPISVSTHALRQRDERIRTACERLAAAFVAHRRSSLSVGDQWSRVNQVVNTEANCMGCSTPFGVLRRRHTCRSVLSPFGSTQRRKRKRKRGCGRGTTHGCFFLFPLAPQVSAGKHTVATVSSAPLKSMQWEPMPRSTCSTHSTSGHRARRYMGVTRASVSLRLRQNSRSAYKDGCQAPLKILDHAWRSLPWRLRALQNFTMPACTA